MTGWFCYVCAETFGGAKLTEDELIVLMEFVKYLAERSDQPPFKGKENKMEPTTMQITLSFPVNADPQAIAAALRMRAGLFEGMPAKEAASRKNTDKAAIESSDSDEDFAPKKASAKAKAAAAFDEETSDVAEEASEDFDAEEAKPAAKAKPKKVTKDDANDACKAHAAEHGLKATKALLKKKFGSESLSEIEPEKFAAVVAAMKV